MYSYVRNSDSGSVMTKVKFPQNADFCKDLSMQIMSSKIVDCIPKYE